MTDGVVYRIKPIGTEECLTYGSDKKLYLKACSDNDEGQKWANKGGSKDFQLIRGTNMCLNKNGKVSDCKNTNDYKWNKTANSQLKSKNDGIKPCIQKKGTNAVEMAGCNNENPQKWDMKPVVITVPTPPSASPGGSPSPSSDSPGSPGSSGSGPTGSATTPTPSPSSDDKKFWETTWFFWSAIGGGAFIVLSIIVCVIIIAMSSRGGGGGGGHHPW